jgi:hypothetical protein
MPKKTLATVLDPSQFIYAEKLAQNDPESTAMLAVSMCSNAAIVPASLIVFGIVHISSRSERFT